MKRNVLQFQKQSKQTNNNQTNNLTNNQTNKQTNATLLTHGSLLLESVVTRCRFPRQRLLRQLAPGSDIDSGRRRCKFLQTKKLAFKNLHNHYKNICLKSSYLKYCVLFCQSRSHSSLLGLEWRRTRLASGGVSIGLIASRPTCTIVCTTKNLRTKFLQTTQIL